MTSEKFMILPRKRHLGVPAEKTFGGGVRFNTAIYPVSAEKQRDKKRHAGENPACRLIF